MYAIQLSGKVMLEVLRDGVCYGTHKVNDALLFRKRHLADLFLVENSALLSRGAQVVEIPERAVEKTDFETRGE